MNDEGARSLIDITRFIFENLQSLDPATVSNWFIWTIVVLFTLGVVFLRVKWRVAKNLRTILSTQLSAIGVLGTFVGIAIGLSTFDVTDLDGSIPRLLDGLKLAFSTSIIGLGASTAYKITEHFALSFSVDSSQASSAAHTFIDEPILVALRLIDKQLEENGESLATLIDKQEKALKRNAG